MRIAALITFLAIAAPPAWSQSPTANHPPGDESLHHKALARQPRSDRLQTTDLEYQGAFRLPDEFNWGALGMSFYPPGAGGGTLLVTGFQSLSDPAHPGEACWNSEWNCSAFYGQVTIPTPAVAANWTELPAATLVDSMIDYDQGLVANWSREYSFVSDIEYVPRRGSQSADKIYGAAEFWYPEGEFGEDSFPTIWMAGLDGGTAAGLFHVGPESPPFHGRKMGSYLFSVPQWYADLYLGGRSLVTGRSRGTPVGLDPVTTAGGSQGPTLFAFRALDSDNPSGDLDALPLLYYRVAFPGCAGPNVGDPALCDYPDFTMCDDWTGAAFVEGETRAAFVLLGWKGLGDNCYDEPPVECNDPCSDSHGYHCDPYERQLIFYDVDEVGANASNSEPWTVVPYAIWRPEEFYMSDGSCWNAGGMTFDPTSDRLFVIERGLGEGGMNAAVVHVWLVADSGNADLIFSDDFELGNTSRW